MPKSIIVVPSALHESPGQGKAHEPMPVEAFVAQPPVEALDVGILHGLAGIDEVQLHPMGVSPSVQDTRLGSTISNYILPEGKTRTS